MSEDINLDDLNLENIKKQIQSILRDDTSGYFYKHGFAIVNFETWQMMKEHVWSKDWNKGIKEIIKERDYYRKIVNDFKNVLEENSHERK